MPGLHSTMVCLCVQACVHAKRLLLSLALPLAYTSQT